MTDTLPNPANLRPRFIGYFGPGYVNVTPQNAWDHFHGSDNPFISGSPQDAEYRAIQQKAMEKERAKWLKLPELTPEIHPTKRRMNMPRLKIKYETLHDIRLRLQHTLIFVGSNLFYVRDVQELDGDFLLILNDSSGITYRCWYNQSDAIDLRTPEPQYIVVEDRQPAFLTRLPGRSQRQGLCSDNAYARWVGSSGTDLFRVHNFNWMMRNIKSDPVLWSSTLYDLMVKAEAFRSVRLSKDIAFYTDSTALHAEYRGRELGVVNDNEISVSEQDAARPWIGRDVRNIGCLLTAKR